MKHVISHFKKVDPILHLAIRNHDWQQLLRPHDHFTGLCRIVIGQQVSTKAAASIFEKFCKLFKKHAPSPKQVLAFTDAKLKTAGLSAAKAASIRDIARRIENGTLAFKDIESRSNDEVIEMLVAARGIGPWSAEMFLIFYLGREDVFSPGDLGLRTAIMKLYKKRILPSPEASVKIAKKWAPYRSYACRILWESLNNSPAS